MRRFLRLEASEPVHQYGSPQNPIRKNSFDGMRVGLSKNGKGSCVRIGQCAECREAVKIFVSPRRNPHSNKLGRAVWMKDHDLCRRCWQRLMHQQCKTGVMVLPLSLFIGGRKLHPRLLMSTLAFLPQEAS